MNSNQESENSQRKSSILDVFKKKWVCFGSIFLLAIVSLIVILIKVNAHKSGEKIEKSIDSGNLTGKVEESFRELSEEEKEAVRKYQEYCVIYNKTVDKYNSSIEKYNDLLKQLSSLEFLKFPDMFPEREHLQSSDVPFSWDKEKLENQRMEMENISAKAEDYYTQLIINTYNCLIDEYNLLAKAYNEAAKESSVEFIEGLPAEVAEKRHIDVLDNDLGQGTLPAREKIEKEAENNEELATYLAIVQQITNPSESWIMDRLKSVNGIIECQPVTLQKDPNQMLGKTGGYTACIYFSHKEIKQDSVKGNDVVDKGTECGGAIEVFLNKTDALNRCEYLSQFDDTLLYTGSYAIIGTMVVRTSYRLTNQQQVELTNAIVECLTLVK